ncbi:exodeoxyribonuclease VII small subunit [Sphingomicrobium sp. XHP0239]|uniref:exodeoxyribonuclease VII small subunit n=1 Tax=Sphingomicrobium maritimum TaxID=3133972 RepID=UPI0031CC8DB1
MTDPAPRPDIASMGFEEALSELETIVRTLEAGDEKLDKSIELFQRGEALKAHCEARLADARERIEKISRDSDGKPTGTQPFDAG